MFWTDGNRATANKYSWPGNVLIARQAQDRPAERRKGETEEVIRTSAEWQDGNDRLITRVTEIQHAVRAFESKEEVHVFHDLSISFRRGERKRETPGTDIRAAIILVTGESRTNYRGCVIDRNSIATVRLDPGGKTLKVIR